MPFLTPARTAGFVGASLALSALGGTAAAAPGPPGAGSGWDTQVVAANQQVTVNGNPMTVTKPDDIARRGRDLFVVYQNTVGPQGQPGPDGVNFSTVVDYRLGSGAVAAWNMTGHTDGLTADPASGELIATVNEDANSSLYTIDPDAKPISQVVHYSYGPSNPLPHGGGTDAISIYHGQILITASAPGTVPSSGTTPATQPAVYTAVLARQPGTNTGTATLTPLFYDGSKATIANTAPPTYGPTSPVPSYGTVPAKGTVEPLALTDPDSNEVVPASSPRFAGDFVLDSQGDEQLVFASGPASPQLSLLDLSQSINDSAFITDTSGTLFVTSPATDQVLAVQGPFRPGEVIAAATPNNANNPVSVGNYLGKIDLANGTVSPLGGVGGIQPQGLLYVPESN